VRPFVLGGERIAHSHGVVAHSDGDTLLHAITDALLGAIGDDDIGQVFPDTDAAHAGRDSMDFLVAAVERVSRRGYRVSNLDATVILERPKLAPHKREIRRRVAAALGCPESRVNIKGKTHEKVDAVGEGRAIEVHCVVLLVRADVREA
jgi:2-C-methyl-D-erythritol 2,4-cyclodiphosphate synthase